MILTSRRTVGSGRQERRRPRDGRKRVSAKKRVVRVPLAPKQTRSQRLALLMIGEGTQSTNQRRHTYVRDNVEVGFFTDPTVCIGCKACEVACKEWNQVPDDGFVWSGNSYDNTGHLGASTWRHVMFVEQDRQKGGQIVGSHSLVGGDGDLSAGASAKAEDPFRWVFLSDVCKHCEEAGCLEACPTGSIVRTEVGSVFVQDDVCNGCGYCVVSCPFGVIDRRPQPMPEAGGAFKCTFCYDRQRAVFRPRVRKFVRLNRSCSGGFMICAHARPNVCNNCGNTVMPTRNCMIPSKRLCAAFTRFSSFSVSPKHTDFRQSPRFRQFI